MVRQVQKIHVRFGGRSYDWAPERLGLDSRSMALASDLEIKRSVAKMLDVELERLEFHAIDFMDENDPGMKDLAEVQPDLRVPWEQKRDLYSAIFAMLAKKHTFMALRDAVHKLQTK